VIEAERLFQTQGRRVAGIYDPHVGNGKPGTLRRLWHFTELRRLARTGGHPELEHLFSTPTWRRIMEQVLLKDGTLRYSTGALERSLVELANRHIVPRGELFTNRARTDCLLMLLQLGELRLSNPREFMRVIDRWVRQNGTPKQSRHMDPSTQDPSLRRPLNDSELAAAGLPTRQHLAAWSKRRYLRMHSRRRKDRYHRDAAFRNAQNRKRVNRRRRNDPDNSSHHRWYKAHAKTECEKALKRKAAAKTRDPARYGELRRAQRRRAHERQKGVFALVAGLGIGKAEARALLEAAEWDLDSVLAREEVAHGEAS
jgi:hypothetical protein